MKRKMKFFGSALIVVFAAMGFYLWGQHADQTGTGLEIVKSAEAAGGAVKSPTGTAPDRYVYFPGTEELGKDEIRLIALGTGMPSARRSQAATCWRPPAGWLSWVTGTSSCSILAPGPMPTWPR
jgi:ribonuclease Z